ncbi:Stringent starvation protein A [Zhongshania aliphaticivorans]|uniref:Stringent starvation protein A n=1 Tax=Zhongshania aliphaticivorans TaxID=1470434 RepID=A0A5S9MV93_9GAMM|nr:glutathione S-transferase family protein [Zhongshania aliphaticivorans]CAA0081371.1 Stringent starvation protein A [Zhongshania aliphaticivorans]CAA0084933.1 Stringent starvation protein A [Zhongshania aliphaticivorans]
MELYNLPHSPYAARVRMLIYERDLAVDLCDPPGGMGSEEYRSLTVMGKVPVLKHGDRYLSESTAIMEYLEALYPDGKLTPEDAWQRSQQSAMIRYVDLYFAQALFPLFQQMKASPRDQQVVDAALVNLSAELKRLQAWYELPELAPSSSLSLADCVVMPVLFYVVSLSPFFGENEPLLATPVLAERWAWAQEQAASKRVLGEMAAGLKAMMSPAN